MACVSTRAPRSSETQHDPSTATLNVTCTALSHNCGTSTYNNPWLPQHTPSPCPVDPSIHPACWRERKSCTTPYPPPLPRPPQGRQHPRSDARVPNIARLHRCLAHTAHGSTNWQQRHATPTRHAHASPLHGPWHRNRTEQNRAATAATAARRRRRSRSRPRPQPSFLRLFRGSTRFSTRAQRRCGKRRRSLAWMRLP